MTLAVHELTTNALKYGALSTSRDIARVRWEVFNKQDRPWLRFRWSESGTAARPVAGEPRRLGFGSELIEARIPYNLG
ncbi:MAG: CHASE domain-containing protein, partial [Sphingomonas sp.]